MNSDEFERQFRISLEDSLNQLQSVRLLMARLLLTVDSVSQNLNDLTLSFEQYIQKQADK